MSEDIKRQDDIFVDLNQLSKVQPEKRTIRVRQEIYNEELATVIRKIKRFAQMKSTCCIYNPPYSVFGKPRYPYEELVTFIIRELIENGLRVERINDNTLWISWSHDDLDWGKYQEFVKKQALKRNRAVPIRDYHRGSLRPERYNGWE